MLGIVRIRLSPSLALLAACSIAACSGGNSNAKSSSSPSTAPSLAADNGRSIFLTGRDSSGNQIRAAKPPLRPACAACHGANGAGGEHLPGGAVSADLRHKALVIDQKHPYTIALLERAISTGIDNDGQPLDPVMPRWKLSKTDLHDVATYVFTQLK